MPGETGGEYLDHRGIPGELATASQCFAGTGWCPFTRIPPGAGILLFADLLSDTVIWTSSTVELFTSPHRTISVDARLLQAGPTGARTSIEGRDRGPRYGL